MWYQLETVRRSRWWFFWNFVVQGKGLKFSVWTDQPAKLNIDTLNATVSEWEYKDEKGSHMEQCQAKDCPAKSEHNCRLCLEGTEVRKL